jgi:hypothetical protein
MLFIDIRAKKPHSLDVRKENCPAHLPFLNCGQALA